MEIPPVQYAVTSDGLRIAHYRYAGASPPFLIVGSPGAIPFALSRAIPALSHKGVNRFGRGRSVVFFEWRGTGKSDPSAGALSAGDLVADLEAVTGAVREPVDGRFLGRGCLAGCLHAARYPHRYRSIELVNGALRMSESWLGMLNRDGWQGSDVDHRIGTLRHYFGLEPAEALRLATRWAREMPMETFAAYLEADNAVDLTDVLPRIHVPALVSAYDLADYTPAAVMASLLPDARLHISEPAIASLDQLDRARDDWDVHMGSRLGDPPSGSPRAAKRHRATGLTPREREVLKLLVAGSSNAQIAEALTLSTRTIEFHIGNIYSKLGVHNRVAAVNAARAAGLVSRSESDHFT
ncbi:MAG: LuxR C-terminal-related transcriptional regulator [Dehalococcoidia bacterium]|nr:hypothetical protein [Dehalococcoidia bacterium]MCB9485762.1 hypothetical protein [Thermoflexaceae bacterium]